MITVKVAKSEQTAIPEINKEAKTIYYLIIGNGKEPETVINVGQKTFVSVQKLLLNDVGETVKVNLPKKQ